MVFKTLASLCFLMIGIFNLDDNSLFVIGLTFDLLGDVLLGLRFLFAKNKMFLLGTIAFLFGHIFYLLGVLKVFNDVTFYIIGIIVGLAAYLFFISICSFPKAMKCVGVLYVPMVFTIAFTGLGQYIDNPCDATLAYMIGTLLFCSSDCILIVYNFGKKKNWMHIVYSFIYYLGQVLIALSLGL